MYIGMELLMDSITNKTIYTIGRFLDADRVKKMYKERKLKAEKRYVFVYAILLIAVITVSLVSVPTIVRTIVTALSIMGFTWTLISLDKLSKDERKSLDDIKLSDSIDLELFIKLESMTDASLLYTMNGMLEANGSDKRVIITRNNGLEECQN